MIVRENKWNIRKQNIKCCVESHVGDITTYGLYDIVKNWNSNILYINDKILKNYVKWTKKSTNKNYIVSTNGYNNGLADILDYKMDFTYGAQYKVSSFICFLPCSTPQQACFNMEDVAINLG